VAAVLKERPANPIDAIARLLEAASGTPVPVQASAGVPSYPRDIRKYENVIMHIGVGGFHRSHQAMYAHELLERGTDPGWALCGVGLMPWDKKMADTLASQDHLYTLLSQGADGAQTTVIGSIMEFLMVPDDPDSAIKRLADPKVKIVSLTITEKGYCLAVNGSLDTNHELVAAELPPGAPPKSAIGLIYRALQARRVAEVPPFTVLSCDNMPGNGTLTRAILLQFVDAKIAAGDAEATELKHWIVRGAVAFPCTMVDRITPITEPAHKELLASAHGIVDSWPVVAEDYRQWVIEDEFTCGRPPWESLGVLCVGSGVHAYESMKLRLLNGGHSALSYVSYLSGHRIVSDAMADPAVAGFLAAYFEEVLPTVEAVPGIELADYCQTLVRRFSNVHIKDTVLRLAEDGSQKLQTTMRPVWLDQIARGASFDVMALAVAGWIRFMSGKDDSGATIEGIKDPRKAELQQAAQAVVASPSAASVAPLLTTFFGEGIGNEARAVDAVVRALDAILSKGTAAALARFVA